MRLTLSRMMLACLGGLIAVQIAESERSLPARVASHFDGEGRGQGSMSRELFLAIYAAGAAYFLMTPFGVGVLARRAPERFVRLPGKAYWLAPSRRETTIRRFGAIVEWCAVLTLGFLAGVMHLTIRANITGRPLPTTPLLAMLVGFLLAMGISGLSLVLAFRRPGDRKADPS